MTQPKRPRRPGLDDPRYLANRQLLKRAGDHICARCHYPIDMQITEWRHPLSWSCDHITPRAQLHPDDPRNWHISNLAEMHRRCNGSKGATTPTPTPPPLNPSIQW